MYKRTHIDIWVLLSFIGMRENVTALNTEGAKKEAAPGKGKGYAMIYFTNTNG